MIAVPARVAEVWVYLSASPLLWLAATLAAYLAADELAGRTNRHPLVNTVALAAAFVIVALVVSHTDYPVYFAGAQFVHFLLGPATVALAVPLYRNLALVRAVLAPMTAALLCGSVTAIVSTVLIARALGAPPELVAALAPRSVTMPIAMTLAQDQGGAPSLAAAMVMLTGVFGAAILSVLMAALRVKDHAAIGFAAGLASHSIGIARAFQIDSAAGTFAGLAMGLNGALTSVLLPLTLGVLGAIAR